MKESFTRFTVAALLALAGVGSSRVAAAELPAPVAAFIKNRCIECHDAETKKGNLDLGALKADFSDAENFARWVKVHDRIEAGEMPPKKKARPPANEIKAVTGALSAALVQAERARLDGESRTGLRRLTRAEYENTVRDLFDMPGVALQNLLPADGMAHGFDKNSDALDISHVNLAKYVEAADKTLETAVATRPTAPPLEKVRLSLAGNYGPDLMLMGGDAMLLRDKKPDPNFPAVGDGKHICRGHAATSISRSCPMMGGGSRGPQRTRATSTIGPITRSSCGRSGPRGRVRSA